MNTTKTKQQGSAKKLTKTPSNLISENGTPNTGILKQNLQEFYNNSKEKLLLLKDEIEVITKDTEKQKEENNLLNLKYNMLQTYNSDLNLKLKGMKEKLIDIHKHKNHLAIQIRETKKDVEATTREIDTMKIDNNYKIKLMQNDIEHITNVKENNIKFIQKKIENEEVYKKELLDRISEIKSEIGKYKELIVDISDSDSKRNKELLKETAEMTKFLSQL
jgi:chromosome segregation ATPase